MRERYIIVFLVIAWLVCGFIGAGWIYSDDRRKVAGVAAFQTEYERRSEIAFVSPYVIGGPITLVGAFFATGFGYSGCWKDYK